MVLIGALVVSVSGCGDQREPAASPPNWTAPREYVPRPAVGIAPDTVSGCPLVGAEESSCLQSWALDRLDGSIAALDEVVVALSLRTYGNQNFFVGACHDVWHEVGERVGELYDLATVVKHWPYSCHGGLLHGAASSRSRHIGAEAYTAEVQDLCAPYAQWEQILLDDCYHGIGHGYGWLEAWEDLFDGCNAMGYTAEPFDWCASGVMEAVVERFTAGSLGTGETAEIEPDALCRRLDKEKDVCWRYIMFPLLADGLELPDILQRCATYDQLDRERCSFAVGGIAASGWVSGSEELALCDGLEGVYRDACWQGAARFVVRLSERDSLQPFGRELDLPPHLRLSLCPVVPTHLRAACLEMEQSELGDELDQYAQAEIGAAWRQANGLSWPSTATK
jgi:hypothetical protein